MNGNNCNSDKVTIKVKLSDEDYHDISIDWSNESFDYRKQLFHQLAAYTGIPIPYICHVWVNSLNGTNPITNMEFETTYDFDIRGEPKEYAMSALNDGDCFLLYSELEFGFHFDSSGLCSILHLVHQDFVDETECNSQYCHYLGSRAFINIFAGKIKSDYLRSVLEPDFVFRTNSNRFSSEFLNLQIINLLDLHCSSRPPFYRARYLRNRG
ncbi:uncharacterized protein LOC107368085 [Tetranychus urticae]|uniref:uncharacterized protein LOC107368085 n=1 Tax=Tetranychus urticae TaxID=32264 RepID=UPI000D658E16|nr:uncharacterized protein LOC107368085 [Tetranychus urticae]